MRLYLDDDSASSLLTRLLRKEGHDVQLPGDAGTAGLEDPVHLSHAIREQRVLLTGNYGDFELLHELVIQSGGHHPGIMVVRRDNDPKRDLTPRGIARCVQNLIAVALPLENQFVILNHWR